MRRGLCAGALAERLKAERPSPGARRRARSPAAARAGRRPQLHDHAGHALAIRGPVPCRQAMGAVMTAPQGDLTYADAPFPDASSLARGLACILGGGSRNGIAP